MWFESDEDALPLPLRCFDDDDDDDDVLEELLLRTLEEPLLLDLFRGSLTELLFPLDRCLLLLLLLLLLA